MGVIVLRDGVVFTKCNNFVLGELMALVAEQIPGDRAADAAFQSAEAVSALMLDTQEPVLAEQLEKLMLQVARAVVAGRLPLRSPPLQHPQNRAMFEESMRALVELVGDPVDGEPSTE